MSFHYRAEAHVAADGHGLDPDLVMAVCLVESSGRTSAYRFEPGFWMRYMVNKPEWDGAIPERVSASYGLMQCMYLTALEHGYPRKDAPEMLFVPTVGLEYGCRILAKLKTWAKGDVQASLAAYNGGRGGNAPGGPLRNQHYSDKVLAQLAQLQAGRLA